MEEMMEEELEFNDSEELRIADAGGTYNASKDFTSLDAWKRCRDVKLFFYSEIIPKLPNGEKYNLDPQIRKAAISVTANIGEGYGRYHFQEGIQFYRIARGSLYELKDHLISCLDLKYIDRQLFDQGNERLELAKRALNGFINFVRKKNQSRA